jgi:glycosyltransferase involved in cell wall biosynthesis
MSRITVVIPTYNSASYILDALDSVFSQTFTDYDVIIVDDGSTDNTRDLLGPYMSRISYHYQPNQGLAVARNVGLSLARGDYLTYLDADDIWEANNLSVKAAILEAFPDLGGVFSEFSIFDARGQQHARGTRQTFPFFERTGWTFGDVFESCREWPIEGGSVAVYTGNIFEKLFHGNFILPTTMVFHRERALAVGPFRAHMRTQQDYEYWLRFSRQHPFAFVDAALARYRRHAGQLTNFKNIERILLAVEEIVNQYEDEMSRAGRRRVFNLRKAQLLVDLAKMHIRKGEARKARARLREVISRDPFRAATYLLYVASLVPAGVLATLRGAR